MTDPDMADATYIEPITPEIVAKIIEKERHAIRRLRAAADHGRPDRAEHARWRCAKMGVLEKYDVEMIGATADAIDKAEDRELFREAMTKIGLETPRSHRTIKTLHEALRGARRHRPARDHPPVASPWAAPAAASPTTATNSSRSSSAASTPRPPTRC